jgi:hypothetical protein
VPPGADRVLSERELNRALLARQLLLDRSKLPLPRALDRLAGIQAQYAPSMYVGLWTRLAGFRREALTRALERRTVVQGTLMRATIHLVSAQDYWPLALATRDERRAWWTRAARADADALAASAERLREELAKGPRWRSELATRTSPEWNGVQHFVDLVRAPPSGTWERRRADRYALAEEWLGKPQRHDDPVGHLVRRYLGGFGPASAADAASFAMLPVTTIREALDRLAPRRFRDERGTDLFDLPRAPLPASDTDAPVRFLPTWDATLLVHARRTQLLPERHRARVFNTKTPNSVGTFLVDGQVAGAWRSVDGRIELEPYERLSRATRAEVEDEAARLASFQA